MTPSLTIGPNDDVYVAWADRRSGLNNIRFAKSLDGGETFLSSSLVESSAFLQNRPCLEIHPNSGVIHLTWSDEREGRLFVYYSKSFDNGDSFLPSISVYPFPPIE